VKETGRGGKERESEVERGKEKKREGTV